MDGGPWFQPAREDLADVAARLRARVPAPALFVPKPWAPWDPDLAARIAALEAPAPVRAGLLLWDDALGESHTLSQGLPGATGAYWHGIMHRREGDLENAGYWFRRVGAHPAFPAVHGAALRIAAAAEAQGNGWAGQRRADLEAAARWDPPRFADWCGATRGSTGPHPVLERIQVAEIEILLQYCQEHGETGD